MYYGGPGGILSAISQDGLAFTKETGVRVPSGSSGSPEMIVSDPTLVKSKDGRVRMYYKGATGPGGPGQAVHRIYSAVSTDGLSFEKEDVRINSQQTPDRGWRGKGREKKRSYALLVMSLWRTVPAWWWM